MGHGNTPASQQPVFNVTEIIEQMIARRLQLKTKSLFVASADRERELEEINTAVAILEFMMRGVYLTIDELALTRGLNRATLLREDAATVSDATLAKELATVAWLLVVLGDDDPPQEVVIGARKPTLREIASRLVYDKTALNSIYLSKLLMTLRMAVQHLWALTRAGASNVGVYHLTLAALGYDLDNSTQRSEIPGYFSSEREN